MKTDRLQPRGFYTDSHSLSEDIKKLKYSELCLGNKNGGGAWEWARKTGTLQMHLSYIHGCIIIQATLGKLVWETAI